MPHLMSEDFEVAFALMEGEGCLRDRLNPRFPPDPHAGDNSIKMARELFEKQKAEWEEEKAEAQASGQSEPTEQPLGMSIYGDGGIHRYFVMVPSGRVLFSRHHCGVGGRIQDALDLGFELG